MKRIFKKIVKELSIIKDIKAVILYGSFAREEYSSRSDIDLFIITEEKKTRKEIQNKIIELENELGKNIQPTIRTIAELQKTDTGLLQNIFQEGKILCLKEPIEIPSTLLLRQKPYLIYIFEMSKLRQRNKARFNRQIYGQIKKKYKSKGLLQKTGGQKLSAGCFMISYSQKVKIE